MLSEGSAAPDFSVETLGGTKVSMRDMRGSPVWLAFFRFASCPLCNYRVHSMIEAWSLFEGRDFGMVAVFQSPAKRLADFVASQKPPFDLVADPKKKLYALYGLESSWIDAAKPSVMATTAKAAAKGIPLVGPMDGPINRVPGDYLIDPGGTIRTAYRGKSIADHLPLERADAFLKSFGV